MYIFNWTDPAGTVHVFQGPILDRTQPQCVSNCPTGFASATDASGFQLKYINRTQSAAASAVYDESGTQIYPTVQDSNGNAWSTDANGDLVDSLGRTPLKVSTSGNSTFYDVLGIGGVYQRYTATTDTMWASTGFSQPGVSEWAGTIPIIRSLQLPDGTQYNFTYDEGSSHTGFFGELIGVQMPRGGMISYGYTTFFDSYQNANRWLSSSTNSAGVTTFTPTTISLCSSGGTGCQEQMTVTKPDQNDVVYSLVLNNGSWNTQIDEYAGHVAGGTRLRTTVPSYDFSQTCPNNSVCTGSYKINKSSEVTTLWDAAGGPISKQITYTTGPAFDEPATIKNWDFYPAGGGVPASPTLEQDYAYAYVVNNAHLVTSYIQKDGAGNQLTQTTYAYDETTGAGHAPLVTTSGLPQHNAVSGNRGNLTTRSEWVNTTGTYLQTAATYNDVGMKQTTSDSNGTTTYSYDATYAYLQSVTEPLTSSGVVLSQGTSYDASAGILLSATDPNGTTSTYSNFDGLERPGELDITAANGTNVKKTTWTYTSSQETQSVYLAPTVHADTVTLFDGYGRSIRKAIASGGSSPWYLEDTCYDALGRVEWHTVPYGGASSTQAISCSGIHQYYDALGRPGTRVTADGTEYVSRSGRATLTTDVNGIQKIVQVDALGQISSVCEISSNASMPGSGTPQACGLDIAGAGFITTYSYDQANHQTTIAQGVQSRLIQTDSIGRTIHVHEPERGDTNYTYSYNALGLLVTRTRPLANQSNPSVTTTTSTQYDAMQRISSVSYDAVVGKRYTYDQVSSGGSGFQFGSGKGRPTTVEAWPGGANWTRTLSAFDALGQETETSQCFPGKCGTSVYDVNRYYFYDPAGNRTTERYLTQGSSGTQVDLQMGYTLAKEVSSISSSLTGSSFDNGAIISSVAQSAVGPTSFVFGNGLTGVHSYDALARLNGVFVCSGSSAFQCAGGSETYGNQEQIAGRRVNGADDTILGTHIGLGYDEFNRLNAASYANGAQQFTFSYDRYGNRWSQSVTVGSGPSAPLGFDTTTNHVSGLTHDAAGNLQSDGLHQYTYDAEGNLTQVDGGTTGSYQYDGFGRRVQSITSSHNDFYGYNSDGQRVAIWDGSSSSPSLLSTTVYWGVTPVAFITQSEVFYPHLDALGTERLVTKWDASTAGSFGSLAFGDGASVSGTDVDPYRYAMLDNDSESSTSHAQSRQYLPSFGRWLSPDQLPASYDFSDPQSFNRYSYVSNNPMSSTDPSGNIMLAPIPVGPVGWILSGISLLGDLFNALGLFDPQAQFHGSTKPRPKTPDHTCSFNANSLDDYLKSKGSPLVGEGQHFMDVGAQFNVDPRLLVTLTGAETTWGTVITRGNYNAWNWMYNTADPSKSDFESWYNGMYSVAHHVPMTYDMSDLTKFYARYCSGNCKEGLTNLKNFMGELNGDPKNLHDPCVKQPE